MRVRVYLVEPSFFSSVRRAVKKIEKKNKKKTLKIYQYSFYFQTQESRLFRKSRTRKLKKDPGDSCFYFLLIRVSQTIFIHSSTRLLYIYFFFWMIPDLVSLVCEFFFPIEYNCWFQNLEKVFAGSNSFNENEMGELIVV